MKNKKFAAVYNYYGKLVMKIAMKLCGDVKDAEEVCQETFEAYYKNMEDIQETLLKPWLMYTVRNTASNHMRKRKIREERFAALYSGTVASEAKNETGTEQKHAFDKQLIRIMEELREANEDWFEILEAVCILEMTEKEAGNYLRMNPQVIRTKLYRARGYIRNKYRDEFESYLLECV